MPVNANEFIEVRTNVISEYVDLIDKELKEKLKDPNALKMYNNRRYVDIEVTTTIRLTPSEYRIINELYVKSNWSGLEKISSSCTPTIEKIGWRLFIRTP